MPRSCLSLSRRDWLRLSALGVLGGSLSGWPEALAAGAGPGRRRSCILLWMSGGPSQMDTFDLKPSHANGGPFKEIATATPGIKISEHLPRLAGHTEDLALVRSLTSKEGEHGLATYYAHAGYPMRGPVQYPTLGAVVAREAGTEPDDLPGFVSIAPFRIFSPAAHAPGFLGPRCAPLIVGDAGAAYPQTPGENDAKTLRVANLSAHAGIGPDRFEARLRLVQQMQTDFVAEHPDAAGKSHATAYERAARLMRTSAGRAFDLDEEPDRLRDRYGRNLFGKGCLLARRLVERGVGFVEVSHGGAGGVGWDTHLNNFETVKELSAVLDAGWATLLEDLKSRGLLETTLIVWLGEFGRTPKINADKGRDHYPYAWTTVLGGGVVKGGQVVGKTSAGGETVTERPVSVPDLLATVCQALGIDPAKTNESNIGRPIPIVDRAARPILEVLR
jgi:hypothetical protein